ncbi:unnamed protein product [Angiostrongylus costaricensis]|uniref:Secreted protein n=1 Tax=Angiostrongylus costaricensis TaxID=334426 RepID=A0A0R3PWK6_ANGCS|nr:unnamed protein product [Angiostrongylus costaricensis]
MNGMRKKKAAVVCLMPSVHPFAGQRAGRPDSSVWWCNKVQSLALTVTALVMTALKTVLYRWSLKKKMSPGTEHEDS